MLNRGAHTPTVTNYKLPVNESVRQKLKTRQAAAELKIATKEISPKCHLTTITLINGVLSSTELKVH
jgi:hypothetical protein